MDEKDYRFVIIVIADEDEDITVDNIVNGDKMECVRITQSFKFLKGDQNFYRLKNFIINCGYLYGGGGTASYFWKLKKEEYEKFISNGKSGLCNKIVVL